MSGFQVGGNSACWKLSCFDFSLLVCRVYMFCWYMPLSCVPIQPGAFVSSSLVLFFKFVVLLLGSSLRIRSPISQHVKLFLFDIHFWASAWLWAVSYSSSSLIWRTVTGRKLLPRVRFHIKRILLLLLPTDKNIQRSSNQCTFLFEKVLSSYYYSTERALGTTTKSNGNASHNNRRGFRIIMTTFLTCLETWAF